MGKGQDKRGTPWKVLKRKPQSKHGNTITKPKKTSVLEKPRDTGTFLERLRLKTIRHMTEERREGLSLSR